MSNPRKQTTKRDSAKPVRWVPTPDGLATGHSMGWTLDIRRQADSDFAWAASFDGVAGEVKGEDYDTMKAAKRAAEQFLAGVEGYVLTDSQKGR